ncbi:MAG TPA: tripartite tricarboxylate transporter substrate-binding protein [Burkholderiaceae bacterium]|nr:tripartite tricarboxylate transporter substrate-binding protein [Burkholderiaceae bacterium]
MIDSTRRRVVAAAAALGAAAVARPAPAQSGYPNRPVKLIVPYAAGGGPDLTARKLAPELARTLGGNVIVENKVGAAGLIAGEVSALLPPDGYNVLLGGATHVIHKAIRPSVKFDPVTSFDPVTLTSTSPTILVVPVDSPYRTVQELAAAMKAKPGVFNYGSGGIGTAAHLSGGAFCKVLQMDAVHVPYRGSVEIVPGLLGGQIQFAFPIAGTALVGIAQGKVRALAVTSAGRMSQLPDVPSLKEVYGSDLLVQESWGCMWVPAGTPKDVIAKLFDAAHAAHATPSVREFAVQSGTDIVLSKSPAELGEFTRSEMGKWAKIVELLGLKAT